MFASLIIFLTFFQCSSDSPKKTLASTEDKTDELGTIQIEVTGNEKAKEYFMAGLLLMHSFEYDDAGEQFQKAQETDPDFVMAYWGEAMTKNHPLWRAQFTDEAQEILQKLAPDAEARLALAKTELEKDLLQGAEILFGEGIKEDRDFVYRDHMLTLTKKYPDNHEVSALYALSLLGAVKDGRDYDEYGKAANIANSIISENNHHPGALHYLIHAYDDPQHAAKALQAANRYSKVAPDAGHALHMPSHIYIALGMWDEVISSNIASYEASVERMKRKDLDDNARGFHALKWWTYALMQKGQFEEARKHLAEMEAFIKNEEASPRMRSHFIQMKAMYLYETGNWEDELSQVNTDHSDLIVALKAVHHFTNGMKHYHQKNKEGLAQSIANIEEEIRKAESDVITKGGKMCSGVSYYNQLPNQQDIDRSKVIAYQLQAMAALLDNKEDKAVKAMQAAVDLEEEVSFMFGPPEIVQPAPEFYGKYLMEKGQHAEAKAMFEKVLERSPKRLIPTKALNSLQDI